MEKTAVEAGFLIPHAAWQVYSGEPGAWRISMSPGALTSGSLRNRVAATDGARARRVKKRIFAEVLRAKLSLRVVGLCGQGLEREDGGRRSRAVQAT